MITISGRDIWRGGEKIGWIEDSEYLFSHETLAKIGYVLDNDVYDHEGHKIGWIEGDYVCGVSGKKMRIEDIRSQIEGGTYPNMIYAAIWLLFGI